MENENKATPVLEGDHDPLVLEDRLRIYIAEILHLEARLAEETNATRSGADAETRAEVLLARARAAGIDLDRLALSRDITRDEADINRLIARLERERKRADHYRAQLDHRPDSERERERREILDEAVVLMRKQVERANLAFEERILTVLMGLIIALLALGAFLSLEGAIVLALIIGIAAVAFRLTRTNWN